MRPTLAETISYAVPTPDLNGHLLHFEGYQNPIGVYPKFRVEENAPGVSG